MTDATDTPRPNGGAPTPEPRDALLDAALMHVPFDGWGPATVKAAIADTGIDPALARALFPRGGLDMAVAFHDRADAALAVELRAADLSAMRIRERISHAVRRRLEIAGDKECVRRAAALFALPTNSVEGARLIWRTADTIWTALGDASDDFNWYSKRSILSGVYGATVLYWLGDDSPDNAPTWEFLDRRIGDVMTFEKVKAKANDSSLFRTVFAGPRWALGRVRAPVRVDGDLPGRMNPGSGSATSG